MAKQPAERFENASQFEKVLRIYTIPTESTSATSLSAIMSVPDAVVDEHQVVPVSRKFEIPRIAVIGGAGVGGLLVLLTLLLAIKALWSTHDAAANSVRTTNAGTTAVVPAASPAAGAAEDPIMLASLGLQYAKRGQFTQAAADYEKALRMNPSEPLNYYYRACLAAYMGDVDAYRNTCRAMYSQFSASTNATIRDKTTKTCSLLENSGVDPKDLLTLSGSLGNSTSPELAAWYSLCQGMALYRAGQYQQAIDVLDNAKTPDRITRATTAQFFQAMAQWRQGHQTDARSLLKEADDRIEKDLPKAGVDDLGRFGVEDWLITQSARRQAQSLITAAH